MRALSPAYVDKKRYVTAAQNLSSDPFNYFLPSVAVTGLSGIGIGALAAATGIWLIYSGLLPFLFVVFWLIKFTIVSKSNHWSWEKTLYTDAHRHYQKISDPESRSMAKSLLENVWIHENAVDGSHSDSYHCSNCAERIELIKTIKINQPKAGNDRADIEEVKMILDIRRELEA